MRRAKVLFVCIGNAHRSQMAEGFARHYGSDVLEAESAGLFPVSGIPEVTHKVMAEKGVSLEEQCAKGVEDVRLHDVDLVVNMSGSPLRGLPVPRIREWKVKDPVGAKESVHRAVRDEIEGLVMGLVLEVRQARAEKKSAFDTGGARGRQ